MRRSQRGPSRQEFGDDRVIENLTTELVHCIEDIEVSDCPRLDWLGCILMPVVAVVLVGVFVVLPIALVVDYFRQAAAHGHNCWLAILTGFWVSLLLIWDWLIISAILLSTKASERGQGLPSENDTDA